MVFIFPFSGLKVVLYGLATLFLFKFKFGVTRNLWGPIIGVLILTIIGEFLRGLGQYETLGYRFI